MKIFNFIVCIFAAFKFCGIATASMQNMPEPYCSIQILPFDDHGWFVNSSQIDEIMQERNIHNVIEIGAWLGMSTRYIASRLPADGKLYTIDTWAGSTTEDLHKSDMRLPYLYQLFLSNVIHANLTNRIVPIRMHSLEAAQALNIQADMLYLDGSHETEDVYQDIIAWNKHLKPNGLLCGDDWSWGSVRLGVNKAAAELNRNVRFDNNFWFFE